MTPIRTPKLPNSIPGEQLGSWDVMKRPCRLTHAGVRKAPDDAADHVAHQDPYGSSGSPRPVGVAA